MEWLIEIDKNLPKDFHLIDYYDILDRIKINIDDLLFDENNKAYLEVNSKLNNLKIYVIKWNGYIDIHDHDDYGCIFKILKGSIKTNLYNKNLEYIKTIYYYQHEKGYIDNEIGYHSVENNDKNASYSLHIYSKNYSPNYFV